MRARDRTAADHNGLLLLKKNPGLTSFESLKAVKKALSSPKVGHTGTLDKFASGLLLVLAGSSLKLAQWFSGVPKEYQGTVLFGAETETLDPEGAITARGPLPSREDVEKVLPLFRGEILQEPPLYSALHINGARAHELARAGERPEIKKRPVTIYELELLAWEAPLAKIRVTCSAGTYIRSLARDIALAAGSRAHLTELIRIRIGGFPLSDAADPDAGPEGLASSLRPVGAETFDALGLPRIAAEEEAVWAMVHGKPLAAVFGDLPDVPVLGVFGPGRAGGEELAAVLEQKQGRWSYGHVFAGH
ncbi:MAG: tRNA pseudouridine(55) synthase TruB [Treponema sp.]|jgi:tRNA pseudouridine55 synthase|nr:tRNA pseudouridine(55) synthase TruB [Treponema sp.]